jgi:glycine C-acetyltransferase
MTATFYDRVSAELADIDAQGLTKPERVIASRQGPVITVGGRDRPQLLRQQLPRPRRRRARRPRRASAATRKSGARARPRCASSAARRRSTRSWNAIADYLGFDDAILFAAAFDANGGVFEPLLGADDAIVSDS